MDVPIKNGGSFHSYVKLPEGILGGTSKPDPPKHGARSIPTRTRSESKLAPHQWQVLPTGQPDGKMARPGVLRGYHGSSNMAMENDHL